MHPLYKILRNGAVKRSSWATVWQARDEVLDREVALKELRNWTARPIRARASFQFAHIRRLSLHHPGLAPIHGADCDRGWLIGDYYTNGSLAAHTDPLPADLARQVLVQVLRTLGFLHEKGFVHAAVKPENLFLTADNQVLLADGLGLRLEENAVSIDRRELFTSIDPSEAKYLAPECLDGKGDQIGPGSDLYALGLTVLELLLGTAWFSMLFPRIQVAAQRWDEWQRSDEMLPSLHELVPDTPDDLSRVIDGLLRKAPSDRISVTAALDILCPPRPEPVAAQPPEPVPAQQPDPVVPQPRSVCIPVVKPDNPLPTPRPRRRRWPMVVSGVCLVTGGMVGWLVFRGKAKVEQPIVSQPVRQQMPTVKISVPPPDAKPSQQRQWTEPDAELTFARAEVEKHLRQIERLTGEWQIADWEAKTQRLRADQLGVELHGVNRKLTRALAEAEQHRSRAAQLTKELKAAQASLLKARAEAQKHRTQLARMQPVKGPWDQIPRVHELDAPPKQSAVTILKNLGAKIEVDEHHPDQPVIKIDLSGTQITNDNLALLEGFTSLQTLYLSSTPVGDAGLVHLKKLTNLRALHLYDTRVSDAGLAHLKHMTQLQTLYLSSTKVKDAGLIHLQQLTNLTTLYLTNTQVSDAGLAYLKKLSRLQTLHLSTTKVGDAGLVHLKDLGNLETLYLSYTQVSDAGLPYLAALPKLREIHLSFTRVTASGIAEFRQSIPDCKIQH